MCQASLSCMIVVLAKMFQANKSRLSGQSQGHGLNKTSNGKSFRVKQEGNKFKYFIGVDPLYGKAPHIIAQGAKFISPSCFVEVYNLSGCIHGWGTTTGTMTPIFLCLNPKARTKQNECFEMQNNERGLCMFRLSTNKCYNEDSNQLNKF